MNHPDFVIENSVARLRRELRDAHREYVTKIQMIGLVDMLPELAPDPKQYELDNILKPVVVALLNEHVESKLYGNFSPIPQKWDGSKGETG